MKTLEELAAYLEKEIITSLESQDHVATGKLRDSIKVNVEKVVSGYAIVGQYLHYGRYVDTGRKARVKRVPVDALIAWIRAKKIDLRGRRERDVAFAIQHAIWKKGIPTDGDPGKLKFLRRVLDGNEKVIQTTIQAFFSNVIAVRIKQSITNAQRIAA